MKLNEEQLQDLKQELRYATRYQETYDELLDHVVTAIDNMDTKEELYATTLTKNIIDNEFGGYEALKDMEKNHARLVMSAMSKKHWENIKWFFNWPTVMLTAALVVVGFMIDSHASSHKVLLLVTFGASVCPFLFIAFKKLMTKYSGYYSGVYTKPSIKDGYIFNAAMLSCNTINVVSFTLRNFNLYGTLNLFVFVVYSVFVLSFFKLYREEYRLITA
ncbi:hypothetical protein [uncultured Mucilaginibacter sp.]|uniref:hypothetical protein n=1 Tax=uncultured Mucilaginibacter sp. TaxID=797541 RepID=UPI0025E2174B|nr:hypothetical protein [uncultured Mucilaginibacter sp.]